ncbi:MAG TPA: class I SAM-dependent methyltransferase [Candidatus Saccharimonadales bacterium]|nr:class I SAM-dependent methyltransferase [Candidatus Saccharimonadales bacterium]
MSKKTFVYTGHENLEAMTEAINYNSYLIKLILQELPDKKTKKIKVLDFGAGSGTYADMLKEKGVEVDCLEPDKKLRTILSQKGYKVLNNVNDLKPESYDLIYALNVFEHIEDDHGNFAALTKTLTKNGIILIYVPAFQSLFSSMDKLVGHHRRYRKTRLRHMASNNNMTILKLHYCDPVGFAAALAFNATRNSTGIISAKSVKLYDTIVFPISTLLEPILKHILGKNVVLVAKNDAK